MQIRSRTTLILDPESLTVEAHRQMGYNLTDGKVIRYDVSATPQQMVMTELEEISSAGLYEAIEEMVNETQPLDSEDDSGGEAQPSVVDTEAVDVDDTSTECTDMELPRPDMESKETQDLVEHERRGLDQSGSTTEDSDIPLIEVNLI